MLVRITWFNSRIPLRVILMNNRPGLIFAFLCLAWLAVAAHAIETDQYLTWGVELKDSAPALNNFINAEVQQFLDAKNKEDGSDFTPETLTEEVMEHLFRIRQSSRVMTWLLTSEELDTYPDASVSNEAYRKSSIFRGRSFPYYLPMARTIRLGDIYVGTDKVGHLFGFGRRYYRRYLRERNIGLSESAAMEKAVRWGIRQENYFVGKLTDGVFSHADLEANFQGLLFARSLCEGNAPHLKKIDGQWVLVRAIDIVPYITPDMDESYNPAHFWALRRRFVLQVMREKYCNPQAAALGAARFAAYGDTPPSFSKRIVDEYFLRRGTNPQQAQSLDALCAREGISPEKNGTVAMLHHKWTTWRRR